MTKLAAAVPQQTLTGRAGFMLKNGQGMIVYPNPHNFDDGIIVKFRLEDTEAMWSLYCNDVEIVVGNDGYYQSGKIV